MANSIRPRGNLGVIMTSASLPRPRAGAILVRVMGRGHHNLLATPAEHWEISRR